MSNIQIEAILKEVRNEQSISPFLEDEIFIQFIKEAEFDINQSSGEKIDYDSDLKARSLLKNYVMYANYKRIAEFKELYRGEYCELQAKYYKPANI